MPEQRLPNAADINPAIDRMFVRHPFVDSPQLSAFLKFIVMETLRGKGEELKGYTIATLALGRPADFDPQTDPIVRVQAGRLRQALVEYYQLYPDETVRIGLEKGSYAPRFFFAETIAKTSADIVPITVTTTETSGVRLSQAQVSEDVTTPHTLSADVYSAHVSKKRENGIGFFLVLFTMGALLLIIGMTALGLLAPKREIAPDVQRTTYFPLLVVESQRGSSDPSELNYIAVRVQDALSRFDDMIVVRDGIDDKSSLPVVPVKAKAERLTLRIAGQYADRGKVRVSARLIEQKDQQVIWSKEFEPVLSGTAGDDERSEIVRAIATAIGRPYGVVHAYARQVFGSGDSAQSDYGCITIALDYWLRNDRATFQAARKCLEEQIAATPRVGALHSQMAYLYLDEYRQGYNDLSKPPLDRAIASAFRGANLAPHSARSYQALMAVHFVRKEMESAWRAGAQARKLNPYDTDIQADLAVRLIQSGQIEKGIEQLEEALSGNNAPPDWATTYQAIAHYMMGNYTRAKDLGQSMSTSEFPLAMIGSILVNYLDRDQAATAERIAKFKRIHPEIYANPQAYLERINLARSIIARLFPSYLAALEWAAKPSG